MALASPFCEHFFNRANKALVAIVQQSLADLRKLTPVTLMWVPGHADIGGNDVADALAKRGARGISSDQAPPATTPHIYVPAPSQACSQEKRWPS